MTKAEQKKAVQYTRMCKFWRTNECKMGADCTFAHGSSELRPSPKPCFEFSKTGFCTRGQACRFIHDTVKSPCSGSEDSLVCRGPVKVGLQTVAAGLEHPEGLALPFRPPPGLSPPSLRAEDLQSLSDVKQELPISRRSSLNDIPLPLKLCTKADTEDLSPDDATIGTRSTASTFCLSMNTSFWL